MMIVVVCDCCIHTYAFLSWHGLAIIKLELMLNHVGLDWQISDEGLCLDASINWQLAMGAEALGTTCMCICWSLILYYMSDLIAKCCDLKCDLNCDLNCDYHCC